MTRVVARRRVKADPRWQYVPEARTYREMRTGRFMSATDQITLRNEVLDRSAARIAGHVDRLTAGEMTPDQFGTAMRSELKSAHLAQYGFGAGGRSQMTDDDIAAVKATLRTQYDYLDGFVEDIDNGALSDDQIAARAAMYGSSSVASYEMGRASSWGADLPAYPGDGDTQCITNCRCAWDIVEREDGQVEATWTLDPGADHCDDCVENAQLWNPYIPGED